MGDPVPNQASYPKCIAGSRVLLHFLCPRGSSFLVPRESARSITIHHGKIRRRRLTLSELNGLKRCASWMRRLRVRDWEFSEDITRLFVPTSSNPHPLLLLTLRKLDWRLNETNVSFAPTFLSSNLTKQICPSPSPREGRSMAR